MPRAMVHEGQKATLEDALNLLVALVQYGWGRCEIVIRAGDIEAIYVTPTLKTREQVRVLTDGLTKGQESA